MEILYLESTLTEDWSKGLVNNIPALLQIMAWRRSGAEQLFEPMLTQFTDVYMRHKREGVS